MTRLDDLRYSASHSTNDALLVWLREVLEDADDGSGVDWDAFYAIRDELAARLSVDCIW